jgi:hypothetical protein
LRRRGAILSAIRRPDAGDPFAIEFAENVTISVICFLVILLAAVVLEWATNFVSSRELLPKFIVRCMAGLASGLFLIDFVSFVCLIAFHTWKLLGALYRQVP